MKQDKRVIAVLVKLLIRSFTTPSTFAGAFAILPKDVTYEQLQDVRQRFSGQFERYGTKKNWHGFPERTILLTAIKDPEGRVVADHVWFTNTKGFQSLGGLDAGDMVEFNARVKAYYKGYTGYDEVISVEKPIELDYKLSHPSKISKI